MRVANLNCNFKARVEKKFVSNTQKYFLNRALAIQYDQFMKQCDKFEMYGHDSTFVFYHGTPNENGFTHALCVKNVKINPKTGLVVAVSNKYSDIINFFQRITDNDVLKWEEDLKSV